MHEIHERTAMKTQLLMPGISHCLVRIARYIQVAVWPILFRDFRAFRGSDYGLRRSRAVEGNSSVSVYRAIVFARNQPGRSSIVSSCDSSSAFAPFLSSSRLPGGVPVPLRAN